MKSDLFLLKSIKAIHHELVAKKIDPVDIAQACIEAYEIFEPQFHAWTVFDKKLMLETSYLLREKIQRGEPLRFFEGIPVGVKDIFNTYHFPSQMGSPLWAGHQSGNDARVIYYLKNQGAVVPGKTVTAEFAVHTLNETLNPHDITKTPGTSSSGSSVAVALGIVPAALGTQTAGSIVRPASFCGVYGCKPSFGLIPRTGILKTTDSLDTIGFFALHYEDLAHLFDATTVKGPNFPFSYEALSNKDRQNKKADRPWKVAFAKTHTWDATPAYAQASMIKWKETLSKDDQIEIVDIDLPSQMRDAHHIHATIYNKTLSYYFKEEFKKAELVSPVMNELISIGNQITVEEYYKALDAQHQLMVAMDDLLGGYDALVSLSTAGEAPLRSVVETPDPALMWTMTHLPVISAPVFKSPSGLPFGVQLVARKYNDLLLFNFCDYLRSKDLIPASLNPIAPARIIK